MKTKPIFSLFFSFLSLMIFAQQKDSLKAKKYIYKPNFMVGVDVLGAGTGFFSDRKVYQGFISSQVKKDIHAVADLGFERNVYQKNGYDATTRGIFVTIGGVYMLAKDPETEFNGFYAGPKIAASFYSQEYFSVPVRGYAGEDSSVSFPPSTQSSFWLEGAVGGRVQLFDSAFYIDVNMQPRYLLYTTRQDDVFPMIVPGFGKSSGKFNVGFAWNLAYRF